MAPPAAPPAGRLRWRCRRGMKELDVLLERFLDRHYCGASAEQQAAFARLIELPDPELAAYLLGDAVPPERRLAELVRWVKLTPRSVTGVTPI